MSVRPPTAQYFKQIRPWEGRQTRAFEELCFQLRPREPTEVELRKTSDPDGGLEWYWIYPDGSEIGWQCKFSDNERSLLSMMDASFESVRKRRSRARQLTFCIPVDLSDDPDGARGEFGWQRFDKLREKWKQKAPGIEVKLFLGGQILEQLALSEHRGREWFWFSQTPVLDPEWCRVQREVAIDSVEPRYRPDINVDLPISEAVAAIAQPVGLRHHFDTLVAAVSKRAAQALENRPTEGPFAQPLDELATAARALIDEARKPWRPTQTLSTEFETALTKLRASTDLLLNVAYDEIDQTSTLRARPENDEGLRARANRALDCEREARRLETAVAELTAWVSGTARAAAESGFLLLDGQGGSGKTHLFCDVAGNLIDEGHPVLLLLGQWFGESSPWKTLAERIGEPDLSMDEIVVALEASAQAADRRMVLMIDAINDAGDFRIWRNHLRELRRRFANSGWVGVVLSCRSTYIEAVAPTGGFGTGVVRATHPGFAGREFEAMERVCRAYGVVEPAVPLLLPEFSNPLFLILYCDTVARGRVPEAGTAHLSAIFAAFVDGRKEEITTALGIDPTLDPVGRAIQVLTSELARRHRDHLPYEEANALVAAIDTSEGRWPETLFGRMLSAGLLSKDLAYFRDEGREGEAVRFPFQRFSDHLIVGGQLDMYLNTTAPHESFGAGASLHDLIAHAPLGSVDALAIQLPERCGVELPDIVNSAGVAQWRGQWALGAFLRSLPTRDPHAVDPARVLPLIDGALEAGLAEEVASALVACGPVPSHPLNGHWLHQDLSQQSLAERDARWMQTTYWAYGEAPHPLDRLIRWAERGPYPEHDPTILELAAIVITWALASPNRFGRDAATKALATLLVGNVAVAQRVVERFTAVDDPYVSERLAAAAYGAILRDAHVPELVAVVELLRALVEMLNESRPNILLRDHVAGVARYVRDRVNGSEADELVARALPPYGAAPPTALRTIAALEEAYPSRLSDDRIGYGSIQHSLFTDFGDFHKYVMRGRVRHFQTTQLGAAEAVDGSPHQQWEQHLSEDFAAAYIFERVVELGWTPERFGDFDASVGRADRGRDSHKPERFGKKYQWIGLFELLARLADNFVFAGMWGEEPRAYLGAWQLSIRDIDPSLPPARARVVAEERTRDPVFAPEAPGGWWVPSGPEFGHVVGDMGAWAHRADDLPDVESLFRRHDSDATTWVVLDGRLEYEEPRDPVADGDLPRRDLGFSFHSAFVRLRDVDVLRRWFDAKTDVMRSLPGWDAQPWGDSYLGELFWAAAAQELDRGWEVDAFRLDTEFPDESLEVTLPWHWPTGFDCSMDDPLNLTVPSPQLVARAGLQRVADSLAWRVGEDVTVRFVETDEGWNRDWALLAREDWLIDFLVREDLALVIGCYGERRVLAADSFSRDIYGWVDLGAGALQANSEWKLRGYDVVWDRRSGKDPD
ncbi:MAG: hypothetical protein JHC84_10800 [Solirubrobacteraceae bacterium]|nr:hypothetical protein [Solirubrobacteraceae bacterium]